MLSKLQSTQIKEYLSQFQSILSNDNDRQVQTQFSEKKNQAINVQKLKEFVRINRLQKIPQQESKKLYNQQKNQFKRRLRGTLPNRSSNRFSHRSCSSNSPESGIKFNKKQKKSKKSLSTYNKLSTKSKFKAKIAEKNQDHEGERKITSEIQYFGSTFFRLSNNHKSAKQLTIDLKGKSQINLRRKKQQLHHKQYNNDNQKTERNKDKDTTKAMTEKMKNILNKLLKMQKNHAKQLNKCYDLSQKEKRRLLKIHMIQKLKLVQQFTNSLQNCI